MRTPYIFCLWAAVAAGALLSGCTTPPVAEPTAGTDQGLQAPVLALARSQSLREMIEGSPETRVWLVGETHDRVDHHQVQLQVFEYLYQSSPALALGVEWFQKPFQAVLNDYVAGRISEAEMLDKTGYFKRWRFDYRLYRPILSYAREHRVPVVALNASQELITALRDTAPDDLPDALKRQLPDAYDFSDLDYADRLRTVYKAHPNSSVDFDTFLRLQLTWDESMAEGIADYLDAHPDRRMLVLAGSGHIRDGSGIPNRLRRRTPVPQKAVLVFDEQLPLSADAADYLVLTVPETLGPAGLLGAMIDDRDGRVVIEDLAEQGALKQTEVRKGDVIVAIDATPVGSFAELKLALLGRRPGDSIELHYLDGGAGVPRSTQVKLR